MTTLVERREVLRFIRSGGDTVVLTEDANGTTRAERKWTKGVRFEPLTIAVKRDGRRRSLWTERPTREEFAAWALRQGYEPTRVR